MPVSGNLYYSLHSDHGTDNPPLVLIHGAGGTHLYWPPEIRRLSGYCVYALDLPGHGKSEHCDGQQTIGDYAGYLVQWLESDPAPPGGFRGSLDGECDCPGYGNPSSGVCRWFGLDQCGGASESQSRHIELCRRPDHILKSDGSTGILFLRLGDIHLI